MLERTSAIWRFVTTGGIVCSGSKPGSVGCMEDLLDW